MAVLEKLDLDIPAGSVTAIVGPSGSGKSSIAAVLLRFVSYSSFLQVEKSLSS